MKKILIPFLLLLIGISFSSFAKKVEITDARLIAKNAYFEQINRHDAIPYQSIDISREYVETYNNHIVYYIFNINDKGFIIITADDNNYPVIGFSFESSYSPSNEAEGFTYWMSERKKEIANNIENNVPADDKTVAMWQHLNSKDFNRVSYNPEMIQDVAPLTTSLWDQIFPYNDFVPVDSTCNSFNNHVTTGCIATSMSQIMYYWRWPNTGVGSHCDTYHNYGQLCADFGSTTYDWDGMVDQPSSECNPISTLMSHTGISVNMQYNTDGQCSSGAYTQDVRTALVNYFRYSTSALYVQKASYSTANWNNLLQGDLNNNQPIEYSGSGSAGGHAWVCDGYQATDYYHFNWGWSGADNGYYYLTNLDPGGDTFNQNQAAVVHITPDPSQYPTYCSGTTDLTTDDFGTIEDGSGPVVNYQNNENCSWLIAPADSISNVRLSFERFSTNPADFLTVYDGATASSPVLGTFSGTTLPTGPIVSTGPQMLVTFVSGSGTPDQGFLLNYKSIPANFCNSTTTLTDYSGSFSDGSGSYQYRNSSSCKYMIEPPFALSITLNFDNFNTEQGPDKVQVYNIGVTPPVLMVSYSGDYTNNPIPPLTVNSGKAMVMWSTNSTIRGAGWNASYTTTTDGVNNIKALSDLSVYPNPTDGMLNIQFTMNQSQSVRMEILSLNGEIMYNQDLGSVTGSIDKQIDLSSFAKGIYILRLISDSGTTNNKIVLK